MNYQRFILGELETNCYLVWSGQSAGVIDPGTPSPELIETMKRSGLTLKWIVNTHGHFDHIGGNSFLQQHYSVPLWIHAADRRMLRSASANLSAFFGSTVTSPDATKTIDDEDQISLGAEEFMVIATPGHTPGGISLYTPGLLFSGDSLFQGSVGRTDFPGGNLQQLMTVIRERLLILDPKTTVLPGHGESTTIGEEIRNIPYLAGGDEI